MKKMLMLLLVVCGVVLALYFWGPYTIRAVCFGDVCPQNGGTYLFYRHAYTETECTATGGKPITGIGWTKVYAGCSPNNFLARLVDTVNN